MAEKTKNQAAPSMEEQLNQSEAFFLKYKNAIIGCVVAFIVVVVIFLLSYFIVWKSYEESLELLLQRSFDLIKLIPEEIKYLIVTKLNE